MAGDTQSEADIRLRERELEIKAAEQASQAADRSAVVHLRERELEIKAAEQACQAAELQARIEELRRSRWTSPLVLAVLAAAVAAASNVAVAVFNGAAQRNLEETKDKLEAALEDRKAESARILEMIKTDQPDRAAVNLEFLLKAGLITNAQLKADLKQYLTDRKPGQGPSLPFVAQSPSSFLGQVIGSGEQPDFCETAAGAPHTALWRRGAQVKGTMNIKPGTVIATFDQDGTFGNRTDGRSNCALYLSQNETGIIALQQWIGHPAAERLIKFGQDHASPANNGDDYFLVIAPPRSP